MFQHLTKLTEKGLDAKTNQKSRCGLSGVMQCILLSFYFVKKETKRKKKDSKFVNHIIHTFDIQIKNGYPMLRYPSTKEKEEK